jgi:hypothetical protein
MKSRSSNSRPAGLSEADEAMWHLRIKIGRCASKYPDLLKHYRFTVGDKAAASRLISGGDASPAPRLFGQKGVRLALSPLFVQRCVADFKATWRAP